MSEMHHAQLSREISTALQLALKSSDSTGVNGYKGKGALGAQPPGVPRSNSATGASSLSGRKQMWASAAAVRAAQMLRTQGGPGQAWRRSVASLPTASYAAVDDTVATESCDAVHKTAMDNSNTGGGYNIQRSESIPEVDEATFEEMLSDPALFDFDFDLDLE